MKLYTLDYNCNQPVTQQVNIATNTDAKIGIKVSKDGEYLNLDGSTLSIELPEIITPEPTVVKGQSRHIQTQLETFMTLICPLSAVVGDDVKATSINFEKSVDDSTWQSATVTGTVNYIDTAISGNSALAQCDVSQGQTQWNWIRTSLAGQKTDTVPATTTSRLQWAGLDTSLALGYWRVNCEAQGKSYHATIPADEELTNGYVTFPITTPDTASYVQYKVAVDKKFNDIVKVTGVFDDPTVAENPSIPKLRADEAGLVGYSVTGEQFDAASYWYWRNANPTPTDLSGWTNPGSWDTIAIMYEEEPFSGGCIVGIDTINGEWYNVFLFKTNGVYEFRWKIAASTPVVKAAAVWKLSKDSVIQHTGVNYKANWYYGGAFQIDFGTVANANFKLNFNTFKSQQGDKDYIGELPYIPSKTINIAGTYTDNTSFSYDVYYKD